MTLGLTAVPAALLGCIGDREPCIIKDQTCLGTNNGFMGSSEEAVRDARQSSACESL